uniref:Uncharacterized protein n=1 Tax=Plectus sambesii TaxID=2011161 RepID=A0A914WFM7_9BILA
MNNYSSPLYRHFVIHLCAIIISAVGLMTTVVDAWFASQTKKNLPDHVSTSCFQCEKGYLRCCVSFLAISTQCAWLVIILLLTVAELIGDRDGWPKGDIALLLRTDIVNENDTMADIQRKFECCGVMLSSNKISNPVDCEHKIEVKNCTEALSDSLLTTPFCIVLLILFVIIVFLLAREKLKKCEKCIKKKAEKEKEKEKPISGQTNVKDTELQPINPDRAPDAVD